MSLLKGKRILITGGLGFIGSSIAHRAVMEGAEKIILVDACLEPYGWNLANIQGIEDQVEFILADVRDKDRMETLMSNQDIVFHMAAQRHRR